MSEENKKEIIYDSGSGLPIVTTPCEPLHIQQHIRTNKDKNAQKIVDRVHAEFDRVSNILDNETSKNEIPPEIWNDLQSKKVMLRDIIRGSIF